MDEKILIVDDEPNVLEGLQRVLRKEFSVVAAIGGEAGLKAVAE
jgi:PleD family two-component response regulator